MTHPSQENCGLPRSGSRTIGPTGGDWSDDPKSPSPTPGARAPGDIRSVTPVRRIVLQFVSAVGVLLIAAVLDFGPTASAAYISVAGDTASAGSVPTDDTPQNPTDPNFDRTPIPVGHLQGGGGMAPSGSGPSSGSAPAVGILPRTELPADGLVVYFREPAALFDLTAFIDSILDPPRQA